MMTSYSIILFIGSVISFTHGAYVVTTPKRWTKGTQSQLCALLTNGLFTSEDKLDINFNPLSKDPNIVHRTVPITLPQGESNACVPFDVPTTDHYTAEINIEGTLSGSFVNETVNVSIANVENATYVQTDKFYYKPGQEVRFRILSLSGPFLQVSTDSYDVVYVENPSRTRIQQWTNVTNPGLVHLSFMLAEEPEEGNYNIYVKNSDGRLRSTNFKVEDYVLPRFEVTIKPVGIILGDDTQVTLKLCAKYTFGQNVEGTASLNVVVGSYRPYANITQEKPISGCQNFTFNTAELRFDDNNCHIRVNNIKANAKVIEAGTGTELVGSNSNIPVNRRVVTFTNLSPKFVQKRFLPVFTSVQAIYNDKTAAASELMNVCTYYNGSNVCKNITTDSDGKLNFITPNTITGGITIKSLKYPRLERNFNDVMEESRSFIYHYRSEKFTEAHNSSLSIYTDEDIKCDHGSEVTFTLPLIYIIGGNPTDKTADINVQIMSRGQIQFSDKRTVQFKKTPLPFDNFTFLLKEQNIPPEIIIGKYDFTVVLPNSVSPKVKVVAWFSKSDGAVIADTKELDVTPCLNHKVSMSWSVNKSEPGSTANLKLSGEAGSICSYGVVDKSVELLSNPSDPLNVNRILNLVNSYDSRRWDGSQQLNLEYCLKKYNKTLDIPTSEPEEPEEPEEPAEPEDDIRSLSTVTSAPSRSKRSFAPIRGTEMEAADIFRKAGFFVFSDLDLESQYCERTINQALKRKIAESQLTQKGEVQNKIANRAPFGESQFQSRPVAAFAGGAAFAAPAPQAESDHLTVTESADIPEEARERTYFPETWLWDLVDLSATGEVSRELTLPDTITEWVGKAVCVHSDKGLGLSPKISIITFTSFFIDLTLPANVKRHEILPVKISIFNYENHDLPVEVILDKSEDYAFDLRKEKGVRVMCIPPNSQQTASIKIKATKIGDVEIAVSAAVAASNKCGPPNPVYKSDRIVRSIPVEAEGFVRERVQSNYLCGEDVQENPIGPMKIEVPTNIVVDSARAYLNVVGDLLGPALENLGNLVRLPFGCGEQNMIRLAPNIYIAQYLRSSKQAKEIEERVIQHMRTGYQRQLTFKRYSGAFSTFGKYDDHGSTWLTAFVLKSFAQAKPFITIDQGIIDKAAKWLKQRQGKDGCFEARGKVINKRMLGGLEKKTSLLTAYVLIALIEAEGFKNQTLIHSAVQCITSDVSIDTATNPYDMALKAYALTLAKTEGAKTHVANLVEAAVMDSAIMRWSIPDIRNRALEVETAGYGLLAMLASDATLHSTHARKVVRWLSSKRNPFGGYASTQDTVVALQALAAFQSSRPSAGQLSLNISAQAGALNKEFLVNDANKLLQQAVKVPTLPTDVQIGMTGTGCASIQTVLRYNILVEDKDAAFDLKLNITPAEGDCASRNMQICVSYTLADGKSNMAVIEATLLTGYVPEKADLRQAVADSPSVKRYEYDYGKVTFYLDEVTPKDICVSFKVFRDIDIDNHQDRYVKVYDYYQPEYTNEQKYNFDLASCNIT